MPIMIENEVTPPAQARRSFTPRPERRINCVFPGMWPFMLAE